MKRLFGLSILSFFSISAYSQVATDRDYGTLVPDNRFTITHEKTDFKDRSDVTSFVHTATPKGELITYKVKDVKSPKKKDFKVSIERMEGKLSRITAIDFASNGSQGVHAVNSAAINQNGYVTSNTHCSDEYTLGFLNSKKDEVSFNCVTVNKAVCDYIEANKIDADLIAEVSACTETMKKFAEHQIALKAASKEEHETNMNAMEDLNGNLSKARNFYELEPKTLKDLADVVNGYTEAQNYCKFFKDENILDVKKDEAPRLELNDKKNKNEYTGYGTGTKKQIRKWKKKNPQGFGNSFSSPNGVGF